MTTTFLNLGDILWRYRMVDSTTRWRKIVTSSSISWQCSDVIGGQSQKINGIRDAYRNNSYNFEAKLMRLLMESTILLLKLLIPSNNSLKVTVLWLWRSKDRKIRFVINEIYQLISIKLFIFRFHKGNLMLSINGDMLK